MTRTRILFTTLLFFILLVTTNVTAQVPTSIPVTFPVQGYHVFEVDSRLILLDTLTGEIQVLDQINVPRIYRSSWNVQGDRIAYNTELDTNVISPFIANQPKSVFPDDPQFATFGVQAWDPSGEVLLGIGTDTNSTYYDLHTFDTVDYSRSLVRRDTVGAPLAEMPQLEVFQTRTASWNPVFDAWIAVQIDTFVVGTEDNPERPVVSVVLVFNRITGEKHILNDLVPASIDSISSNAWSPDGRKLVLEAELAGTQTQIVSVLDENGDWQFASGPSAPDMPLHAQSVIGWFGVTDLLLFTERDTDTVEQAYSIAQIINGELHITEFFRIPITSFSSAPYPSIGRGDWLLTASEAQKHTLSCLFDLAMPTRLSIDTRARVNFTDGTPLRLRTEPDFESTEITQMPEGTAFDVIGGAACVNSDFYYRFWQLELDDGTVGWAAEANNTDYFIGPVEEVE